MKKVYKSINPVSDAKPVQEREATSQYYYEKKKKLVTLSEDWYF